MEGVFKVASIYPGKFQAPKAGGQIFVEESRLCAMHPVVGWVCVVAVVVSCVPAGASPCSDLSDSAAATTAATAHSRMWSPSTGMLA